jgi:hypothetical protein
MRTLQLIWFFGPSAAGKETLVRRVARNAHDPLRQHLALAGRVEVCAESLDKEVARWRLAEVLTRCPLSDGETLLVKGQSADIWDDREPSLRIPEQLAAALPTCTQKVVFVWARAEQTRSKMPRAGDPGGRAW